MLKGKFVRTYKKNGRTIFVYQVTGSDEMKMKYEEVQGSNFRETEDKEPLFFTTRYSGDNIDILITPNNRVVVDTSEFDKAASMAEQFGGNLGDAIANQSALKLLGNMRRTAQPVQEIAKPVPDEGKLGD